MYLARVEARMLGRYLRVCPKQLFGGADEKRAEADAIRKILNLPARCIGPAAPQKGWDLPAY